MLYQINQIRFIPQDRSHVFSPLWLSSSSSSRLGENICRDIEIYTKRETRHLSYLRGSTAGGNGFTLCCRCLPPFISRKVLGVSWTFLGSCACWPCCLCCLLPYCRLWFLFYFIWGFGLATLDGYRIVTAMEYKEKRALPVLGIYVIGLGF